MNNFGNFFSPPYALDLTKRERVETWYRNARYFIMASVLLTCLFTGLSLIEPHQFLLTLTIPYVLMVWGYLNSGLAPANVCEFFTEMGFTVTENDDSLFMMTAVASLFVLLLYIICWYRSKDYHVGWLFAALVLMLIDTAVMIVILGFHPFGIVFHGGIIALLIIGINAQFRLKKMPPDPSDYYSLDELN